MIRRGDRDIGWSKDTEREQIAVLLDAYEIFQQKNGERGDMWREFPPSDKIRELRERITRIERIWQNGTLVVHDYGISHPMSFADISVLIEQECLDIINYSAFLIRQLKEGASG